MIRASQKWSKERHTSWTEWVAGMQEKIVEWWQDTMPACIRQEVQNLEAIEGMIDELLQHCGQALVTHWVTAQVADATESHPACPTCGKPWRCVSRHRSLHKTGRFGEYAWTRPYWVVVQQPGRRIRHPQFAA